MRALVKRCRNIRHRSKEQQWIVLGRKKSAPTPKCCGPFINRSDDQGAPADQSRRGDTAREFVSQKTGRDALTRPRLVRRELAQEQTGNRVGRLTGANRT